MMINVEKCVFMVISVARGPFSFSSKEAVLKHNYHKHCCELIVKCSEENA
jgi:hypothetical protein